MTIHTRVTRLDGLATVRRARILPYPGEVLTPVGQQVSPFQVVARAPDYLDFQILRASDVLGVKAEDLGKYLLVELGAHLEKGTPIMHRPALFGRTKVFRSPVEGYLNLIHDGCLVIHRANDLIELRAQLPGHIVSIIPELGVVIEATGALIQAVWDSGKDSYGRLLKVSENASGSVQAELVGNQARGAVLIAGTATDLDLLTHLEDQGVRGLIVGSLSQSLSKAVQKLAYPVMATEGIGELPMAASIYHHLSQSEGREVSLLAAHQGPRSQPGEIFMPLPAPRRTETKINGLKLGSEVRVLRPGGNLAAGKVVHLQPLPRWNSLGMPMPGAEIELNGGERKFVPYTNIELLHN